MDKETKMQSETTIFGAVIKSIDFLSSFNQTSLLSESSEAQYKLGYKSIVYAAISKIARTCASVEWNIVDLNGEKQPNHRFVERFKNPSSQMSWYDLIELTVIYMYLFGDAYWYVDNEQKIYILPPYYIVPITTNGLEIDYYDAPLLIGKKKFELNEIVHFKFPNPFNQIDGTSVLSKVDYDFDIINQAKEKTVYFFKNNAIPSGIFTTDAQAKESDIDRIESRWRGKYGGTKNTGKVAFLFGGWRWIQMGQPPNADNYISPAKWARDDLLATFGVPPALLGYYEDINRSNAYVSNEIFMRDTIAPLLKKIEHTINYKLFKNIVQEPVEIRFENVVPENVQMKIEQQKLNIQKAQIGFMTASLTVNEIRELLGFAPLNNEQGQKMVKIDNVESFDEIKALLETLKEY